MTTELLTHLDLRFLSQEQEIQQERLPVQGTIPPWLCGTLIRNGPAKFEAGQQAYRHWFDGLAMLHKFSFKEGQVSYANRFLRSRAYRAAAETAAITYAEFATDPCRSIFRRLLTGFRPVFSDNANINVVRVADRYVALTETLLPVEFDPATLQTVGAFEYGDRVRGHHTTAHPHHDFQHGQSITYVTRFCFKSTYSVYCIASGHSRRALMTRVPVKEPGYMHSFALTENYVVLVEFPLVVKPMKLLLGGRPFIENYRWKPERGARFLVLDRKEGRLQGIYEAEAFFAFHHVNAFQRDGNLIIDIAAYPDAAIIESLYVDQLRERRKIPSAQLRRYTLRLQQGRTDFLVRRDSGVDYQVISPAAIELPRINYGSSNGKDYEFAYGVSTIDPSGGDFADQLVKIHVRQGTESIWREEGCYPGEPVFVPYPNSKEEKEGVILSVVLDAKSGVSFLLILDAGSFEEIARGTVPRHVPLGFHGQFFKEIG